MRYYYVDKSRIGMILLLGALLIAIGALVTHAEYKESKAAKFDTTNRPAATSANYSNASAPAAVSLTSRSVAAPMVSGGAVRSYAYSGHATMPTAASGSSFTVRTTSSATLHSYGAGGGGGGGFSGGGSSSSRGGITYGGGAVSMPALAMATPSRRSRSEAGLMAETSEQSAAASQGYSVPRIRKAKPTEPGEDGDWQYGGEGERDWWYYDEDHWREPGENETRFDPTLGYTVVWNGSEWVKESEYEPGVPVGDVPWIILLMLVAVYAFAKKRTSKTCD